MNYQVYLTTSADRELNNLPHDVYDRVIQRIHNLASNPRPRGVRKLSGTDHYRIRVGSYRVIYDINDDANTVTVSTVVHRREAYR